MYTKTIINSILQKKYSTNLINNLVNKSFNIYTNKLNIPYNTFFNDIILMNEKLLYFLNNYFKHNISNNDKIPNNLNKNNDYKRKIAVLYPPSYCHLLLKFCCFINNYDYISIPLPIKKSKNIENKYLFYIAENQSDLILCHPFYKHYIEEISFHLNIPFLICYDKPDILSYEEYLEDLKEGTDIFHEKYLYSNLKKKEIQNDNIQENNTENIKWNIYNIIEVLKDKNVNIFLQLSKENECDTILKFKLFNIYNQADNLNKLLNINSKDNALICLTPNNISYFDILFLLIRNGSTVIFPEINTNKILHFKDYKSWFKNNIKTKGENNFSIHNLIIQKNFDKINFDFIDGNSLFDEIYKCEKKISVLICNNYLIRDFIEFFENSPINKKTKEKFITEIASNIRIILLNGNEIRPVIDKSYLQKMKNIFINSKIYERYVIQEIGTVSLIELNDLLYDNIYERNIAGFKLPDINIEIDEKINILKIKSNNSFIEYYNDINKTQNSFDNNGYFKTKYLASINKNLLKIHGYYNHIQNISDEYKLYYKQRRDKMEKLPIGYIKRVRLHGHIWGNFHAHKKNWKRKF